jgi:hypothetical protein
VVDIRALGSRARGWSRIGFLHHGYVEASAPLGGSAEADRGIVLTHTVDAYISYEPEAAKRGWLVLHVGSRRFQVRIIDQSELCRIFRRANQAPERLAIVDRETCWLFEGRYYLDNAGLNQQEVHRLLIELRSSV